MMALQLNIKGDEAYGLASELADLTGESMTAAVTVALRERLDRERRLRSGDSAARRDHILALAAEIRAGMRQPLPGSDHGALYGRAEAEAGAGE